MEYRINRPERTVNWLVERLEANDVSRLTSSNAHPHRFRSTHQPRRDFAPHANRQSISSTEPSAAPVIIIRGVAVDVGVSPEALRTAQSPDAEGSRDIIESGLLSN